MIGAAAESISKSLDLFSIPGEQQTFIGIHRPTRCNRNGSAKLIKYFPVTGKLERNNVNNNDFFTAEVMRKGLQKWWTVGSVTLPYAPIQ